MYDESSHKQYRFWTLLKDLCKKKSATRAYAPELLMYLNLATLGQARADLVYSPQTGQLVRDNLCSAPVIAYLSKDLEGASNAFGENAASVAPRAAEFYDAREKKYMGKMRGKSPLSAKQTRVLRILRKVAGDDVNRFRRLLMRIPDFKVVLLHFVDWKGKERSSVDDIIKALEWWPSSISVMQVLLTVVVLAGVVSLAFMKRKSLTEWWNRGKSAPPPPQPQCEPQPWYELGMLSKETCEAGTIPGQSRVFHWWEEDLYKNVKNPSLEKYLKYDPATNVQDVLHLMIAEGVARTRAQSFLSAINRYRIPLEQTWWRPKSWISSGQSGFDCRLPSEKDYTSDFDETVPWRSVFWSRHPDMRNPDRKDTDIAKDMASTAQTSYILALDYIQRFRKHHNIAANNPDKTMEDLRNRVKDELNNQGRSTVQSYRKIQNWIDEAFNNISSNEKLQLSLVWLRGTKGSLPIV